MANAQPKFLAATAVGITLSAFFVGGNLAGSKIAVPALLLPSASNAATTSSTKPTTSNPQLARQWRYIYDNGKAVAIPIAIGSSLAYAYAGLQLPSALQTQRYLFIASATLAVLVMPYTLTAMNSTNTELLQRAEEGDGMKEVGDGHVTEVGMPTIKGVEGQRTEELIRRWALLNVGRAAIPMVGIGCAIAALIW